MQFFNELGERIDARWKREHYADAAFPSVATEALESTKPSDHVGLMDVVEAVHREPYMLDGGGFDHDFGQPPVTIFRTPHFLIQVLFWLESTTSIHQHSFSGAFHVLEGSSIHTQFSFGRTKRFSDRLLLGQLSRTSVEHLKQGAVRPILNGGGTIHSLFHLDHPSISVVVRTPQSAIAEPQYSYLLPGIAYDALLRRESLFLKEKTLRLLARTKHPRLIEVASRSIREADAFEAFRMLLELMACVEPAETYEAILDAVLPAHAEIVEHARTAAEERYREQNIIARRSAITQPEHRFFLGVLLNARSRPDALALVAQAYPGMPPEDRIAGWAAELGRVNVRDPRTGEMTSPIGVPIADTELTIFRHLLSGATDAQVLARLAEEFGASAVEEQRDELLPICDAFRKSGLFRLLLA